jgi:DNA polymerase-3 subunit gamma/tau
MKIAPKIGRTAPREQQAPAQEAPPADPDADRHRGRPSVGNPNQARTSAGAATGAPTWNVAPIPGEPRVADDGPGSAWDEFAEGPAPAPEAAPAPAPSPEEIAANEQAVRERETEPVEMPEVTIHVETADADLHNPIDAQGSVDAPAPAGEPQPAADAGTASAPPAPSWNVVAVPGSEPEPEPEPATTPEPEPEVSNAPRHPALEAGQERYGESVIRERLGARFIGEELRVIAAPAGPIDEAPDDFEAPPEEY